MDFVSWDFDSIMVLPSSQMLITLYWAIASFIHNCIYTELHVTSTQFLQRYNNTIIIIVCTYCIAFTRYATEYNGTFKIQSKNSDKHLQNGYSINARPRLTLFITRHHSPLVTHFIYCILYTLYVIINGIRELNSHAFMLHSSAVIIMMCCVTEHGLSQNTQARWLP